MTPVKKRILVPVEGTLLDEDAVELACEMAIRDKAELILLYVIEVQRHMSLQAPQTSEIAKAEGRLEDLARRAMGKKCRAQVETLQARTAGVAIVGEAINREATLIVMSVGMRNRFGESEVAERALHVLRNAPCRVLLVRAATAGGRS